jgi:hypothetical protein
MVFYFNILNNKLLSQNALNLSKSNAISIKKLGSSIFMFEIRNFHRTINNFDDKSNNNNNNKNYSNNNKNINYNDNSSKSTNNKSKNKLNKLNKLAKMSFISMNDKILSEQAKISSSKIEVNRSVNANQTEQKENANIAFKTKEMRPNADPPVRKSIQTTFQKTNSDKKATTTYSPELKSQSNFTILSKDSSYKLARLIDSINPEKTVEELMDVPGKLSKYKEIKKNEELAELTSQIEKLNNIKINFAKKSVKTEVPIDKSIDIK